MFYKECQQETQCPETTGVRRLPSTMSTGIWDGSDGPFPWFLQKGSSCSFLRPGAFGGSWWQSWVWPWWWGILDVGGEVLWCRGHERQASPHMQAAKDWRMGQSLRQDGPSVAWWGLCGWQGRWERWHNWSVSRRRWIKEQLELLFCQSAVMKEGLVLGQLLLGRCIGALSFPEFRGVQRTALQLNELWYRKVMLELDKAASHPEFLK